MKPPKVSIDIGKQHSLKSGECIFNEGDTGAEMYVVQSGRVRIYLKTQKQIITLATLKKGDFFGEMALLEELPRSASAEAVGEVALISLSKSDFKFLIQQHPDIAMKVLAKFSTRLRDADHLIELFLLGDTIGHVIHALVKIARLKFGKNQKLPKECHLEIGISQLAEQMGLDVSSVDKVMVELDRMGLAEIQDDHIVIRKHRKLRTYLKYLDWKSGA